MAEQQDNAQSISAGMSYRQGSIELMLKLLDEIALYDRQIRLWGVQAQEK